jgi:hypothetical protein
MIIRKSAHQDIRGESKFHASFWLKDTNIIV